MNVVHTIAKDDSEVTASLREAIAMDFDFALVIGEKDGTMHIKSTHCDKRVATIGRMVEAIYHLLKAADDV